MWRLNSIVSHALFQVPLVWCAPRPWDRRALRIALWCAPWTDIHRTTGLNWVRFVHRTVHWQIWHQFYFWITPLLHAVQRLSCWAHILWELMLSSSVSGEHRPTAADEIRRVLSDARHWATAGKRGDITFIWFYEDIIIEYFLTEDFLLQANVLNFRLCTLSVGRLCRREIEGCVVSGRF